MDERIAKCDLWLERRGAFEHVVVSSRARFARNLQMVPFPHCASDGERGRVYRRVAEAIEQVPQLTGAIHFELSQLGRKERSYLRESNVISQEMEIVDSYKERGLFLSPDVRVGVMVNEEDHLRIFALEAGFQPYEVLKRASDLEMTLDNLLAFAFSERFGYLTACPSNTGTGLRISVMLHLPGLVLTEQVSQIFEAMPQLGMTVRGFQGERSENHGNFFQLSNEVTLGLSEEQIVDRFKKIIEDLIAKEEAARHELFKNHGLKLEDQIWRAFGILSHARQVTSHEALSLLTLLRLGVDRGFFRGLDHHALNRLAIEVQPSHIELRRQASGPESRDEARALFLRERLAMAAPRN